MLWDVLVVCTQHDFAITRMQVDRAGAGDGGQTDRQADKYRATRSDNVSIDNGAATIPPSPASKGLVTAVFELRGGKYECEAKRDSAGDRGSSPPFQACS